MLNIFHIDWLFVSLPLRTFHPIHSPFMGWIFFFTFNVLSSLYVLVSNAPIRHVAAVGSCHTVGCFSTPLLSLPTEAFQFHTNPNQFLPLLPGVLSRKFLPEPCFRCFLAAPEIRIYTESCDAVWLDFWYSYMDLVSSIHVREIQFSTSVC